MKHFQLFAAAIIVGLGLTVTGAAAKSVTDVTTNSSSCYPANNEKLKRAGALSMYKQALGLAKKACCNNGNYPVIAPSVEIVTIIENTCRDGGGKVSLSVIWNYKCSDEVLKQCDRF